MNNIKTYFTSKYILWLILAIPGTLLTVNYYRDQVNYDMIMHITGEFAGRMLIISLIATPLKLLFPKGKIAKWLLRNRRFFGVAAFSYTLLHTIFYVLEYPLEKSVSEFSNTSILSGWIAFFIFIPLAITSTNTAIRKMGKSWKKLQRWVYVAAILAFIHWAILGLQGTEKSAAAAIVHFIPVIVLQIYRIWKQQIIKNKTSLK